MQRTSTGPEMFSELKPASSGATEELERCVMSGLGLMSISRIHAF